MNWIKQSVKKRENLSSTDSITLYTGILFAEISKYVYDRSKLKDILPFTDDIDKTKTFMIRR